MWQPHFVSLPGQTSRSMVMLTGTIAAISRRRATRNLLFMFFTYLRYKNATSGTFRPKEWRTFHRFCQAPLQPYVAPSLACFGMVLTRSRTTPSSTSWRAAVGVGCCTASFLPGRRRSFASRLGASTAPGEARTEWYGQGSIAARIPSPAPARWTRSPQRQPAWAARPKTDRATSYAP